MLLREEHLQARLTQHVPPAEHLDRIDGKHVTIHQARACMSASGTLPPAPTSCPSTVSYMYARELRTCTTLESGQETMESPTLLSSAGWK